MSYPKPINNLPSLHLLDRAKHVAAAAMRRSVWEPADASIWPLTVAILPPAEAMVKLKHTENMLGLSAPEDADD